MKEQPLHKDKAFFLFMGILVFIVSSVGMWHFLTMGKCIHYNSQEEAQRDLVKYPNLDGYPKDGLACNSYFK